MKNKITLTIIALISIFNLYAQESIIFNKDYAWSKDDKSVTIHFDLAVYAPNTFYDVSIIASLNGKKVKATTTKGDLGGYVESGEGKRITWDITADLGELKTTDVLTVDLVAHKVKTQILAKSSKTPKILGWSSIGIGSLVAGYGVYTELNASSDYKIYKENTDESASVYTDMELTRNELYDDANGRHKTAQTLMIAGGTLVLTGITVLIMKKISANKIRKAITVLPVVSPGFVSLGNIKPQYNIFVSYSF